MVVKWEAMDSDQGLLMKEKQEKPQSADQIPRSETQSPEVNLVRWDDDASPPRWDWKGLPIVNHEY